MFVFLFFFFFQAEDGIRDRDVTGVQTCALPILRRLPRPEPALGRCRAPRGPLHGPVWRAGLTALSGPRVRAPPRARGRRRLLLRSEERRVGKGCRARVAQERWKEER